MFVSKAVFKFITSKPKASRSLRFVGVILVFMVGIFSSGCGGAAPTATPVPPTDVKVQMSWTHEYSSAYLYTAEVNGHFAKQNLKVSLVEGGFVDGQYVEPIDQVLSGEYDFGVTDSATLLQARANGKPVVAVTTIYQRNPTAIISLAEADIKQPQDLIGKTVAVAEGGATAVLKIMLTSQGINLDDVNIVPRPGFGIDPLTNGDVDALVGWIINEGVQVREAGLEPSFMLLNDYGVPSYNLLVFTSEDTIQQKRDMVERFLKAITDGLDDVVSDPTKAVEAVLKYNSTLDSEGQLQRLQASIPLIKPAGMKIGVMQAEVWKTIYDVLTASNSLTGTVDYTTAYDLSFMDKISNASS